MQFCLQRITRFRSLVFPLYASDYIAGMWATCTIYPWMQTHSGVQSETQGTCLCYGIKFKQFRNHGIELLDYLPWSAPLDIQAEIADYEIAVIALQSRCMGLDIFIAPEQSFLIVLWVHCLSASSALLKNCSGNRSRWVCKWWLQRPLWPSISGWAAYGLLKKTGWPLCDSFYLRTGSVWTMIRRVSM